VRIRVADYRRSPTQARPVQHPCKRAIREQSRLPRPIVASFSMSTRWPPGPARW
jgi:hypothetical protein